MAISVQELIEKLNLKPIDLSKLDESRGLCFKNVLLTQTKTFELIGCVFYRCCLVGVGFDQPNSVFIECTKRETMYALSIKEVCEFGKTSLRYVTRLNLSGADLQGASLQGVYLDSANLQDADLQDANLQCANLFFVNLKHANLQRANLYDANLKNAKLDHANLERANLEGADLRLAQLQGANLQGANLHDANLLYANLHNVLYDKNTKGLTEEQKTVMIETSEEDS